MKNTLPAKVLLVDASALCYTAYYTMGQLTRRDGFETGIVYGFFSQLGHICKTLRIAHVAFCWDSKKSRRRRLFSDYKRGRRATEKPDDLIKCYSQFDDLRKSIVPQFFVNNFQSTGFEADDIIASICRFPGPQENQQYIILSSDQDLYQLLTDRVSMYKINKKEMYTKWDFIDDWYIKPHLWASVKAMAGCTSDNVPGIPGVGEKTAVKYIFEIKTKPHKLIDTIEAREIIKRNKPLVTLPFAGTPKYELDWDHLPSYADWVEFCEQYQFASFLKAPDIWEHIFTATVPSNGLDKITIGGRRPKA